MYRWNRPSLSPVIAKWPPQIQVYLNKCKRIVIDGTPAPGPLQMSWIPPVGTWTTQHT